MPAAGLFLYGQPGNGKTSIAERLIDALSPYIWIPRTITVSGEIIRLFDPASHIEAPLENPQRPVARHAALRSPLGPHSPAADRRWRRIAVGPTRNHEQSQRPAFSNPPSSSRATAARLVVDDFGRQRCSASDLLNRWIVPLEKGHDYLNLPSGRQIQIPFDQLLVFSTNLPPQKLVDEAFLRRIPYKIEVNDPDAARISRADPAVVRQS